MFLFFIFIFLWNIVLQWKKKQKKRSRDEEENEKEGVTEKGEAKWEKNELLYFWAGKVSYGCVLGIVT